MDISLEGLILLLTQTLVRAHNGETTDEEVDKVIALADQFGLEETLIQVQDGEM